MAAINIYLNFAGNTEEAFEFYRSVFGGEFTALQRFKDVPGMDNLPTADQGKLMHIALSIGDNMLLHATDALESMGQKLVAGNNFYIYIEAANKKDADDYFNKLSVGGNVEMAMQDMFWGAYYGAFADQFGVQWMVNYQHTPLQS